MALRGSVWSFGLNKRLWTFPTLLTGEMFCDKFLYSPGPYVLFGSYIVRRNKMQVTAVDPTKFQFISSKNITKTSERPFFYYPQSFIKTSLHTNYTPIFFFLNCQPELSLISVSIALNIRNPKQENGRIFCGARAREQGRVYIIQ